MLSFKWNWMVLHLFSSVFMKHQILANLTIDWQHLIVQEKCRVTSKLKSGPVCKCFDFQIANACPGIAHGKSIRIQLYSFNSKSRINMNRDIDINVVFVLFITLIFRKFALLYLYQSFQVKFSSDESHLWLCIITKNSLIP